MNIPINSEHVHFHSYSFSGKSITNLPHPPLPPTPALYLPRHREQTLRAKGFVNAELLRTTHAHQALACRRAGDRWTMGATAVCLINGISSGKHTKNYGKSPFLMGKSTINGHVQVRKLLVYQRVS
jgi:hypothetical protein